MKRKELIEQIRTKYSFLCVGLDTDIEKIPSFLLGHSDPVFEFNKRIIDATKEFAVAYKPNIAFYEAQGSRGWESLKKTLEYIPKNCFTIADAKRGDIGNTSSLYARTFFKTYPFDSVTVAPYMGKDSVAPFLEFDEKWVIVLALTSNSGSADFQHNKLEDGQSLYQKVISESIKWGSPENLMFVVGATQAKHLVEIRKLIPDHFLLIPGVGAQGGSLEEVAEYGLNQDVGLLVNASRSIIFASSGLDFAEHAAIQAMKIQLEMKQILDKRFNR